MAGGDKEVDPQDVHIQQRVYTPKENVDPCRKVAIVFIILFFVALIAFGTILAIYLTEENNNNNSNNHDPPPVCGATSKNPNKYRSNLDEPTNPGIFHDVTSSEIKRVRAFLEKAINLTKPEEGHLSDARIYTMGLEAPNKAEALAYLDHNAPQPARYARVYIFRGDLPKPVVEERVCGPLHNVTSCDVALTAPFNYRPMEYYEYVVYDKYLMPKIQDQLGYILSDSFNGSSDWNSDYYLNYWVTPVGSNIYGESGVRKMWILFVYDISYMVLHPIDMSVLVDVSGVDPSLFSVDKVWYNGKLYNSSQELNEAYNSTGFNKTKITYPTERDDYFAQMDRRQNPIPAKPQRPPVMQVPDGNRFSIQQKHINYLDMWSFDFLMQPLRGPFLYDIRFLGERIVYEVGVMELASIYSGYGPQSRQQMLLDTAYLMGSRSKALVPGADCPVTATYLPITVTSQAKEKPAVFSRAVCVFERNSGDPLRRHHSYSRNEGGFYGGMLDSSLVVRTIMVVDNYDYIVDFSFHQNGAFGVNVRLSGYLFTTFWMPQTQPWGFQIHKNLFAAAHMHIFNFKVDLDIKDGAFNRYETINVVEETVKLRGTNRDISSFKLMNSLKQTELDAAFKYNFDQPSYHVFYSNHTNKYGFRKGYRLVNNGYTKLLIKTGLGNEPAVPWARYQMAVTKFNQSEQRSTSCFGQWDSLDPIINFQSFLDDNDNIVDEDLVAWVSIGNYHIPHTEDLPVVDTPGQDTEFFLVPYNYFLEDPSMRSRDGVFIKIKDKDKPEEGLTFDWDQGEALKRHDGGACLYKPLDTESEWKQDPDDLFEMIEDKGVL